MTTISLLNGVVLARLLSLARLVPKSYAAYRPLVMDGLLFFLERLPPQRLEAIIAEQLELPLASSTARRLVILFRQCPTLHKLGQVVAHDRRLAPELRKRLQELESLPPTTHMRDIKAILRSELGKLAGLEVASRPLAEASVAVVVPFVWRDSVSSVSQHGVFKVLRPRVVEKLREELEIFLALGFFLEERCAHYGLPVFDYRNTLESVSRLLLNEIRLDQEQTHLAQAAKFYADTPAILIPRLFPFCTPYVTAMEQVDGGKVTDSGASPWQRRQLAGTIIDALLAEPFWLSAESSAFFHGDPHAGNLFQTHDGRLAILDWALVTQLSKAQRETVIQTVLGALTLNDAMVCQSIAALGRISDLATLQNAVSDALGQVRRGTFPGFDWLTSLLDSLASTSAVQFPEEVILFRKALLTLSGVVADVSGNPSIDQVLIKSGGLQFIRDLALRLLAPVNSRAFGAHLSNQDLFGVWAGMPVTVARFWSGM